MSPGPAGAKILPTAPQAGMVAYRVVAIRRGSEPEIPIQLLGRRRAFGWAGTDCPVRLDARPMGHNDHVPYFADHVVPLHFDCHPLAVAGAVLIAQLGHAARLRGGRGHRPRFVNIVCHRLLAEDVLAGGQRRQADGGVHVVGHGGVDRIDAAALALQHLAPVGILPRLGAARPPRPESRHRRHRWPPPPRRGNRGTSQNPLRPSCRPRRCRHDAACYWRPQTRFQQPPPDTPAVA